MIGKTLQQILKEKGINPNELAKMIGVSNQTLYSIIKRDNMKIDFEVLLKICSALDVNVDRFYSIYINESGTTTEGNPKSKVENLSSSERRHLEKYNTLDVRGKATVDNVLDFEYKRMQTLKDQYKEEFACGLCEVLKFPVQEYKEKVCAGTGNYLDYTTASITVLSYKPPKGTDFIVTVAGDSMQPTILDGDRLFISKDKNLNYGDLGIFYIPGQGLVVKEYTPAGLKAHNDAYPFVGGNGDIETIGKVLEKVK